jgi:hypothetical protein
MAGEIEVDMTGSWRSAYQLIGENEKDAPSRPDLDELVGKR